MSGQKLPAARDHNNQTSGAPWWAKRQRGQVEGCSRHNTQRWDVCTQYQWCSSKLLGPLNEVQSQMAQQGKIMDQRDTSCIKGWNWSILKDKRREHHEEKQQHLLLCIKVLLCLLHKFAMTMSHAAAVQRNKVMTCTVVNKAQGIKTFISNHDLALNIEIARIWALKAWHKASKEEENPPNKEEISGDSPTMCMETKGRENGQIFYENYYQNFGRNRTAEYDD